MSGSESRVGRLWLAVAIAAASFLPALFFHYVGEEAIFPISSLEMWQRGDWVRQTLYGSHVQHTPLFNWLIISVASAVGWEHVLVVARAITVAATCLTGLVVAGLAQVLRANRGLAAFSALAYLTLADVFFYRGWLAYVDPLFALFTASAVAALWIACHRRQAGWLWAAAAALTLALLSKALTAYVFYGLAALVLFAADRGYRAFLLSPASWLAHAVALALPLAWFDLVPGAGGQSSRLLGDILEKLAPQGLAAYAAKLVIFPAETVLRLAPVPLIAVYYLWRMRGTPGGGAGREPRTALWIAAVNFLPYWIAPQSAIRYLMPLYPFVALAAAWIVWNAGEAAVRVTVRWLAAAVILKLAVVLGAFPYYQSHYRGENHWLAARDIHGRTAGHPLYTRDDSATGLSVSAHLDVMRLPRAALTFPPAAWNDAFLISPAPDPKQGSVVRHYRLGRNDLYLLCRGAACGSGT